MTIEEEIQGLLEQEQTLQFAEFTSGTAWAIGSAIADRARKEQRTIVIDITRHGQQLFRFALDGTSPDNTYWIARKMNVTNRYNMSSLRFRRLQEQSGMTLEQRRHVSENEYALSGGCFPIIIKNVGVVGTITVSGMKDTEDHAFVTDAIRDYLSK